MGTVRRVAIRAWNWLTSMRTALILLFLLALAAVPGAVLPQRALNQTKVEDYIANHGTVAKVYDKLQLFDVFSSHWFTAVYVLLFVSLVGCIIPRTWNHLSALRRPPVRAPLRLQRMPRYSSGCMSLTEDELRERVHRELKGWRITEYTATEDRAGFPSIAAEKGYLHEVANLVFHLGLLGILLSVGFGRLTYYEGQAIVVAGEDNSEFCNTAVANYDSFRAGRTFDGTGLDAFCLQVHDFTADYLENGQATTFSSHVSYAEGANVYAPASTWKKYLLQVNHPLRVAGDRVYLQGHGYAPTITVTWPNGQKRTQTVQFRPDDPRLFLSSGAMRFDPPAGMYPDLAKRRHNQIALQGLFAPTASWSGANNELLSSIFPGARNPALAIDIYRGDAGLDSGRGQSIFSLDPGQIHSGDLQKIQRANLQLGDSTTLDDGTVITFDGVKDFVNLQVSHDAGQVWVLISTLVALGSLALSFAIKRRRLWVRWKVRDDGTLDVETAGLARTDRAGWGEEHDRFARRLRGLASPDDDDYDENADAQVIRRTPA